MDKRDRERFDVNRANMQLANMIIKNMKENGDLDFQDSNFLEGAAICVMSDCIKFIMAGMSDEKKLIDFQRTLFSVLSVAQEEENRG